MQLHHKLAVLAFLYVIALAGNVALCAWCVIEYHTVLLEGSGAVARGIAAATSQTRTFDPSAITGILLLNAALACGVAVVALRFVRRWIMRPITDLQNAAVQIGAGNLQHRVRPTGRDELSALGEAVDHMASEVVRMQTALVEQERREVASRALRCVVHNIRSPLTGIRWLAEALMARSTVSAPLKNLESRIVRSVDGILEWLQAFRHSLTGVAIKREPTPITDILADLGAWAQGHRLEIEENGPATLTVDAGQIRAALEAVINCVARTADPEDGLRLAIGNSKATADVVEFVIGVANAPGQGQEGLVAVASPDSGTVAMAERIIRLHGGELMAGRDSRGRLTLTITIPAG